MNSCEGFYRGFLAKKGETLPDVMGILSIKEMANTWTGRGFKMSESSNTPSPAVLPSEEKENISRYDNLFAGFRNNGNEVEILSP